MRKKILLAAGIAAAGLLFYTVKCQLGVDLIPDFSWEKEFPVLNVFQKYARVVSPGPGETLLLASFDEAFPAMLWGGVYGPDTRRVKDRVVPGGRNGTKALLIDNRSPEEWVKEYFHWVAVKPGEVFSFSGFFRLPGRTRASMAVTLYDAGRKVVAYRYGNVVVDGAGTGEWQKIENRVTVPEGVAFIRLRLEGSGQGMAFADDVSFRREK